MRAVMLAMVGMMMVAGSAVAESPEDNRVMSGPELRAEMDLNGKLDAYIERNGYPDVAEWGFLADEGPWDEHQVTLYYLDAHKQISFARAWILGEPSVHLEKSERPMTQEQVDQMRPLARSYAGGQRADGSPASRAEAAALRAEDAASRADAAAASAERAADRTEAVVSRMETVARRARRK